MSSENKIDDNSIFFKGILSNISLGINISKSNLQKEKFKFNQSIGTLFENIIKYKDGFTNEIAKLEEKCISIEKKTKEGLDNTNDNIFYAVNEIIYNFSSLNNEIDFLFKNKIGKFISEILEGVKKISNAYTLQGIKFEDEEILIKTNKVNDFRSGLTVSNTCSLVFLSPIQIPVFIFPPMTNHLNNEDENENENEDSEKIKINKLIDIEYKDERTDMEEIQNKIEITEIILPLESDCIKNNINSDLKKFLNKKRNKSNSREGSLDSDNNQKFNKFYSGKKNGNYENNIYKKKKKEEIFNLVHTGNNRSVNPFTSNINITTNTNTSNLFDEDIAKRLKKKFPDFKIDFKSIIPYLKVKIINSFEFNLLNMNFIENKIKELSQDPIEETIILIKISTTRQQETCTTNSFLYSSLMEFFEKRCATFKTTELLIGGKIKSDLNLLSIFKAISTDHFMKTHFITSIKILQYNFLEDLLSDVEDYHGKMMTHNIEKNEYKERKEHQEIVKKLRMEYYDILKSG